MIPISEVIAYFRAQKSQNKENGSKVDSAVERKPGTGKEVGSKGKGCEAERQEGRRRVPGDKLQTREGNLGLG